MMIKKSSNGKRQESALTRSAAHGALDIPTKCPRPKKQEAKVSQEGAI